MEKSWLTVFFLASLQHIKNYYFIRMKKTIQLVLALAIVALVGTSCKSKQKVAEITGANVVVGSTTTSPTVTTPAVSQPESTPTNEPEVTRNEKFSLSDGDANSMNYKYHVVVGSFKNQDNAKNLKATLNNEGNQALVVVNEQGMFRVLIASFDTYAEARAQINAIKERFPDSWVLVQK